MVSHFKNPIKRIFFPALLSGLLTGCGHLTPLTFKFLPLVGFPFFLVLTDYILPRRRTYFWATWAFSLGYLSISLYWISMALTVDLHYFWWLIPPTLLLFPAFLALYFATLTALFPWPRYKGVPKIFWGSAIWLLAELARSYLLTGFPWPLLGYLWVPALPIAQLAYLTTIYGLTLLAFWTVSTPYLLWRSPRKVSYIYCALLALLLGTITWGGFYKLQGPNKLDVLPSFLLVQPNIPQKLKWNGKYRQQNLQQLMQLSQNTAGPSPQLIIWPEAALPYDFSEALGQHLTRIIPEGSYLITGVMRYETQEGEFKVWNSLYAINDQGERVHIYNKSHLVPFGEYVPFKKWLDKIAPGLIRNVSEGLMETTPGQGLQSVSLPNISPFSPLICYEVIFPKQVIASGAAKPAWILNLTNDAWYGDTAGPYQHLEIAQMRAIEEGVALVRATNTGISALIDAHGRLIKTLPYNEEGVILWG